MKNGLLAASQGCSQLLQAGGMPASHTLHLPLRFLDEAAAPIERTGARSHLAERSVALAPTLARFTREIWL